MTYPDAPNTQPGYVPPPPPRKSNTWKIVLIVFAVCAVFAFTCCGGFFGFLFSAKASVEPVADAFLDALAAKDYAAAYEVASPQWKAKQNLADFTATLERVEGILGAPTSYSSHSFNVNKTNNTGTAELVYTVQYAKASAEATVSLEDSGSGWKVLAYNIDSPLLTQAQTCPKCGTFNPGFANFCSKCGEKL